MHYDNEGFNMSWTLKVYWYFVVQVEYTVGRSV